MISAMHDNFHTFEPQFGYKVSYGERIFRPDGASHYESVRDLLRKKPEAKSATSWRPPGGSPEVVQEVA
jgi:hypothetical protein